MTNNLKHIIVDNYTTIKGKTISLKLSYQLFGKPLHNAPIVLVNHALTGNSNVSGKSGWWKDLIGNKKAIDTNKFTVLAFNIPGNGFDNFIINDYKKVIAKDIAKLFLLGLQKLQIKNLFAIIGGSLGGGIAWEMTILNPQITKNLIPIASDFKATDWLIANCKIQEQFLENSKNPVHDARMHAMLCYRTPESFKQRFDRSKKENSDIFNVESWLLHHGKKLQKRYQLASYKLMNQLLRTINAVESNQSSTQILKSIKSNIHIISVNSDMFFTPQESQNTFIALYKVKNNVTYSEIKSVHGHDAFLIEYQQLSKIIAPIFSDNNILNR